ncbi:hypothetical protein AB0C10_01500 [Microbispora amethystogenes]|uniref:hypothetical protein n=1 Tax=Microbispora amethystogenes TaxID=1427754 RepID=UPI00340CE8B1
MRWGADLHCSGRLTRSGGTDDAPVLTLGQVRGDACYPGRVSITPQGDRTATFEVTRAGEGGIRYSGSLTRTE